MPSLVHAAPKLCTPAGEAPAALHALPAGLVLCFGDACQKLDDGAKVAAPISVFPKTGKKLTAAITKFKLENNNDASNVTSSDDGKLVGIQAHLWDVAKDKELKVQQRTPDGANLGFVGFAGNAPIGVFYACAGPCGVGYPLDGNGKVRGKGVPGGNGVALDDKRVLIVPSQASGEVSIVEVKTGKALGAVKLGDGMSAVIRSAATKLASGNVAVFYDTGDKSEVLEISAPADKPASVVKTTAIPACQF